MLPWEHAAIAYLLYSGYSRLRYGRPPNGWAVLVVLFASQLPDLIDKPLAWQFALIPSGRSLAHSVFVGVPLSAVAVVLARQYEAHEIGSAFWIGYLSHLATDAVALYPGAETNFASILWPLVSQEGAPHTHGGFFERAAAILIGDYPSLLVLEPTTNVLIGVSMVAGMFLVWNLDGRPGVRETLRLFGWPLTKLRTALRE